MMFGVGDLRICPNEARYPRSRMWHGETPGPRVFKVCYLNFIPSRVFDMLASLLIHGEERGEEYGDDDDLLSG